ncbi:MAG: thiamine pyrophosphate-binding protein [Chloroflexota bacterium]
MEKRSGAKLFVEALKANRVEYLIGIHGTQTLDVLDILYDDPSIKVITVRHEEASAFIANGYAKITGRPAVCFSIPGPGATNMVTSVAAGYTESLPMVIIAAQIPLELMSRATAHKCDLEGVFRPIAKEVITCQEVDDIPPMLNRAFEIATEGRSGPAVIIIPANLFGARGEAEVAAPVKKEWQPDGALEAKITQAAAILEKAQAPTIFAGGGVVKAGCADELQKLAEKLSAPVFTSDSARGVIPENHELCGGLFSFEGALEVLGRSDACLTLGTTFTEFATLNWTVKFPENLIEVNIAPGLLGQVYQPKVALAADVRYVLPKLLGMVSRKQGDAASLEIMSRSKKQNARETTDFMKLPPAFPLHPQWLVNKLREVMPEDAVLLVDTISLGLWLRQHEYVVYRPKTLIHNNGFGAMGYALPAAIGVKLAKPDLKVACVVGDGSFLMQMSELATIAAYGISLPILVISNGCFGPLYQNQYYLYKKRFIGTELNNPDFLGIARSFGLNSLRIASPEEFPIALEKALTSKVSTLVEVPADITRISRFQRKRWASKGMVLDGAQS